MFKLKSVCKNKKDFLPVKNWTRASLQFQFLLHLPNPRTLR